MKLKMNIPDEVLIKLAWCKLIGFALFLSFLLIFTLIIK